MYQLKIGTIPLPKLYVCLKHEASKCRELGIPYIIKPQSWPDEKLVKAVLWRTLHDKFPYIKWKEILGFNRAPKLFINVSCNQDKDDVDDVDEELPNFDVENFDTDEEEVFESGEIREVAAEHRANPGFDTCGASDNKMEVTEDAEYRPTSGGLSEEDSLDFDSPMFDSVAIDDYIGDLGFYVNIEQLQQLRILPTFLDDIANAVKMNMMNSMFMDGYNKKLECNIGSWRGSDQAPNLIILDVSGSIPSGVAGTMISLIETLRNQANADLIITSGRSEFWPAQSELPDPDKLSYMIGGCNECTQFYAILRKHVFGKHWGNVIVFGDQDSPMRNDIQVEVRSGLTTNIEDNELQSTKIDRIMAFHTYKKKVPGYGLWAVNACPKAEVVYNTDWVESMERY